MKYTGTTDGAAEGKRPGTEAFVELMIKNFGFTNLGTWGVRNMKGVEPPRLSVHATGRASDLGYKWDDPAVRAKVATVIQWLVDNHEALGVEEVHDYSGVSKKGSETWGRGFRCERKELGGKAGWREWSATDNGGSAQGRWIHVELCPDHAATRDAMLKAWRGVTKPTV